jgi:hypothetical protein
LPQPDSRASPFGTTELEDIVATFVSADLAQTERALYALADPTHRWHAHAVTGILDSEPGWRCDLLSHRFCLPILRAMLDDPATTEVVFRIRGKRLFREADAVTDIRPLPPELTGLDLKAEVSERRCDVAAQMLNSVVIGLPHHHALLKHADANLAAIRKSVDQFKGRLAKARPIEFRMFATFGDEKLLLLPDFPTLNRPATADDVKAGRAVFHTDGKGKRVEKKLPLIGELKSKGNKEAGERVLIVQAETNADGEVIYGVIARYSVHAVPASAFSRVTAMDSKVWDDKE